MITPKKTKTILKLIHYLQNTSPHCQLILEYSDKTTGEIKHHLLTGRPNGMVCLHGRQILYKDLFKLLSGINANHLNSVYKHRETKGRQPHGIILRKPNV